MFAPNPHFPSAYERPKSLPTIAKKVPTQDGAEIASFLYGTEPTSAKGCVLFLHGNGEEHQIFGPFIDQLVEAGYAVLAIDSRAQGLSSRGSLPLSYELFASDTLEVLKAFEIDSCSVIGFSDGGITALLLALEKEALTIDKALVIGANINPEGLIEEDDFDLKALVAELSEWADALESGYFDTDKIDLSLMRPSATEARQQAELLQLMIDEPQIDASRLSAIEAEVYLLVGEYDAIDPAHTQLIYESIPHSELMLIREAGHTIPKHNISELKEIIAELW